MLKNFDNEKKPPVFSGSHTSKLMEKNNKNKEVFCNLIIFNFI